VLQNVVIDLEGSDEQQAGLVVRIISGAHII
jgi:hypothetical protein